MRIGLDVREVDPTHSGQQRYLWRLGAWLAGQGHDVHYLTVRARDRGRTAGPEPTGTPTGPGAPVGRAAGPGVPVGAAIGPSVPPGTTLHRMDRLSRRRLRDAVAGLAPDVLLLNPERSRRYRGISAHVLRAGYGTDQYRQKLRSFGPIAAMLRRGLRRTPWVLAERRWERAFYTARPAPRVIAQSEYMRGEILADYPIPEGHVHVVHNGVDLSEFNPDVRSRGGASARLRWGASDEELCLVVLAHNFRLKGVGEALDALTRLREGPPVHLIVAGSGTGSAQRRAFERAAHRADLGPHRVTFAGPVRPATSVLAAADALLHLSWHDSFGFAVLEAMACGLPVIVTPFAGAAELVRDAGSGRIVRPDRPREIVDAIVAFGDPATRARLGRAAAAKATAHDEVTSFRGVLAVFEAVV